MAKKKRKKNKHRSTKSYTENYRLSNTNTLKYWDEFRCSTNATLMYIFPYIVKIEVTVSLLAFLVISNIGGMGSFTHHL